MAYYRLLENLTIGNKIEHKGTVIQLNQKPETIQKLLAVEAISPLRTPPLIELGEEWKNKIKRLEAIGVITAIDFLDTDTNLISKTLKMKVSMVEGIKQDLVNQWLAPEIIEKDCCG